MPKKGKKSKSKSDKKGKKKNVAKEESLTKMAERNSNLWEAKLRMIEYHKEHYKETSKHLVEENTSLVDYMRQTEKDTVDVVSYLRKIDAEKDAQIASLQNELKHINNRNQREKEAIINEFTTKIVDCEEALNKKENECELIQNELNQLKEFRKRKIQMQKELEEIKEAMILNEREHKDHMMRVESKFFEEKMRLQIEANKKIEELAVKAHDAAIKNLDDITRNIYKENVQLTESFKLNAQEIESLTRTGQTLRADNERLRAHRAANDALVQEKVELAGKQARQIKELQARLAVLEKSLSQVVREFEVERERLVAACQTELASSGAELDKLRKTLELKSREMNRVKKLAKNIIQQRTDIERFFLDSLDFVKKQIVSNRAEYKKEASALYNNKMLAAHMGQAEYPRVRTFSKKFDAFSTNSVYKDLEQAEKWTGWNAIEKKYNMNQLVDLGDLTWEQKEQVLRELFARMNGAKVENKERAEAAAAAAGPLAISEFRKNYQSDDESEKSSAEPSSAKHTGSAAFKKQTAGFTFITQSNAATDDLLAHRSAARLPAIGSSLQQLQ